MKGSYERMSGVLGKLFLYNFSGTEVMCEIKAYASVIDEMNNTLNKMILECFTDTASSYGLEQKELMIGAVRDDLSVEKRRSMLKLRESIDASSFTPDKIRKSLDSFGLEYVLHEYPSLYIVVVDAVGEYSDAQKSWIRNQVKKIMPAHLEVQVVFNGIRWATIDSENRTFGTMDDYDLTWEEIDDLE